MIEFIHSDIFIFALVFAVYYGALDLSRRFHTILLNPVLITIILLICFLEFSGLEYEEFQRPGHLIEFWLKPAIVALGLPLYTYMKDIKRQFLPIFISQLIGSAIGIISVVLISKWLGASREVIISLAPKSVTTPIAVEISSKLGGLPSLTAAVVVIVGLFGAIFGMRMLQIGRIKSHIAQGLSMGTAAHVMGTNRVTEIGERYGAYATVGLILNGVLTAILAPILLDWLL